MTRLLDSLPTATLPRCLLLAVVTCSGLLALRWLWMPSVEIVLPAELETTYAVMPGAAASPTQTPLDFVFRPLFNKSRSPIQASTSAAPVEPEQDEQIVVVDMKGYRLLGTFASTGQEGVIIKGKGGKRQRLLIGEILNGWRLDAVNARSGSFTSESGEIAELGLAFAKLPKQPSVLVTAPVPLSTGSGDLSEANDSTEVDEVAEPEPVPSFPTTFDEIWERRKREAEQAQNARGGSPKSSPGAQKK